MDDLPPYSERNIGEDKIEILYRNGDKYIGNKDMTLGIYISPRKVVQMGISKSRGKFLYKENRPEWCVKGDCYNGEGEALFYSNRVNKFFDDNMKFMTEDQKYIYKFIGQYKDFEEYNGKFFGRVIKKIQRNEKRFSREEELRRASIDGLNRGFYGSSPEDNQTQDSYIEFFMFDLKDGKINEQSPEYIILKKNLAIEQKEYDKKRDEENKMSMERAKKEREELNQFINKMFNFGARDLSSCIRLCTKYNITYNCSSKCQDAMNINR
jgi:hypothetical protein